jgi:DNA-binding transcriptional regulator/RsmH inhibitor MraZ
MKFFEDRHSHKMDPKNRVSVPIVFRPEEEGEPIRLQLSKEHGTEQVIKVMSCEVFQKKFSDIEEADMPKAKKLTLAGALRMNSRQAVISSQGKITIPREWAEKLGLKTEGQVVFAGRDTYYIMCSEEIFARIEAADYSMDDGGLGVL